MLVLILLLGGVVPESTIRSSMINAYRRYGSIHNASLYLGSRLVASRVTEDILRSMDLSTNQTRECLEWTLPANVRRQQVYVASDRDPCNGREVVEWAQQQEYVVAIGMGRGIQQTWLEQIGGPCGMFGCVQGVNWVKI